jgi:hypothetical protein
MPESVDEVRQVDVDEETVDSHSPVEDDMIYRDQFVKGRYLCRTHVRRLREMVL